jgi:LPS sulfotransferase NodH
VSVSAGYLLCGTPRTGSTLLCGLLTSTGVLGRPRSWFREPDEPAIAHELGAPVPRDGPVDYRRYVQAVSDAGRTPNGVFGARVMWGSLDHLVAGLAGPVRPRDLDVLQEALGPLAVIHLRRADIVGQAVSWCRAEQTGYWQRGDTAHAEPSEDISRLLDLVDTIRTHEAAWLDWFDRNDVRPLHMTYEALVHDPAGAVSRVAAHLGIALPRSWRARPEETRQADDLNRRWATALRAALDTHDVPRPHPQS